MTWDFERRHEKESYGQLKHTGVSAFPIYDKNLLLIGKTCQRSWWEITRESIQGTRSFYKDPSTKGSWMWVNYRNIKKTFHPFQPNSLQIFNQRKSSTSNNNEKHTFRSLELLNPVFEPREAEKIVGSFDPTPTSLKKLETCSHAHREDESKIRDFSTHARLKLSWWLHPITFGSF